MINDNIRKNRFKTLPYFVEGHILPEMGICWRPTLSYWVRGSNICNGTNSYFPLWCSESWACDMMRFELTGLYDSVDPTLATTPRRKLNILCSISRVPLAYITSWNVSKMCMLFVINVSCPGLLFPCVPCPWFPYKYRAPFSVLKYCLQAFKSKRKVSWRWKHKRMFYLETLKILSEKTISLRYHQLHIVPFCECIYMQHKRQTHVL